MIFYSSRVKGGIRLKGTPFIIINPKHTGDRGLIAHEQEHVKQYLMLFPLGALLYPFIGLMCLIACMFVCDLLYTFIPKFRLWSEIRAYKAQLKHGGDINYAAKVIAENYDLNITAAEALKKLQVRVE